MEIPYAHPGKGPQGASGYLVLHLQRHYGAAGTNGTLRLYDRILCHTIELPWRGNQQRISCIPEGWYRLYREHFPRNGDQLALSNVPGRSAILIHAANNAARELQGCIAPVTRITGPGTGIHSRIALERLKDVAYPVLQAGESVWLHISAAPDTL